MAITVSSPSVDRGARQFQGAFKEMWQVTATLSFAAIGAGAEDTGDITVNGVAVGDSVIAFAVNADPEENIFVYNPMVSAANTVSFSVTNLSGSSDTPAATEVKLLIGRPNW